jgi:hypothetical protein
MSPHFERVYTPAERRMSFETRFLHALQSACEPLMNRLQHIAIVIVTCGKEATP